MARSGQHSAGPLVGREVMLAEVSSMLAADRHVLLTGRAGAGKTRFAEELVGAVIAGGGRVEQVMASVATTAFQLGAFGPVARSVNVDVGDVPSLLNFHLSRWTSLAHKRRPVLLWIDDVHHLDDLSAVLCRHGIATGVVQLLLTHRAPEALPADITALLTADELAVVDVPSLRRTATVELAQASSERRLTDAEIEQIHHLSDGLPLFIRDLARSLGSGGSAEAVHRSGGLHEILSGLPIGLRRVAELIAVAEPLPIRLLGRHRTELLDLMARGVVRRHGDGDVRLEHPLYSAWLIEALGPLATDVFDELVTCSEGFEVNATLAADWRIRAGRDLDPDLAREAIQAALASSDAATAQRLIPHLDEGSEVLAAQAILLGGDLEKGLDRLDQVRQHSSDTEQRLEAAGVLARHVGLTKGDLAAAWAILAAADDDDLDPALRSPLLLGRLWLSFFGGPIVPEDLELVRTLVGQSLPADTATHDLLAAAVSLMSLFDCSRVQPLLRRLQEFEEELEVGSQPHAGAASAQGWAHLFNGDGPAAIDVFTRRFDQVVRRQDADGVGLLGGSGGYGAALCGAIQLSVTMSSAAVDAASPVDWYGHGHLAALVQRGSQYLAGGPTRAAEPPTDGPAAVTSLDLNLLLAARAESLRLEATGEGAPASTILDPLELLASHLKRSWVLAGVAELADHRSDPAIHKLAIESSAGVPRSEPVYAAFTDIAHARLDDDAEGILDAGERYESFGLVSAAARAYADVLRLTDDASDLRHRGVQGLARCLLAWDGGPMWWTAGLSNVPTPRQLIVARLAAAGQSSGEIADELILSKRTVENHLYRVLRSLGIAGRDELAVTLAPRRSRARIVL